MMNSFPNRYGTLIFKPCPQDWWDAPQSKTPTQSKCTLLPPPMSASLRECMPSSKLQKFSKQYEQFRNQFPLTKVILQLPSCLQNIYNATPSSSLDFTQSDQVIQDSPTQQLSLTHRQCKEFGNHIHIYIYKIYCPPLELQVDRTPNLLINQCCGGVEFFFLHVSCHRAAVTWDEFTPHSRINLRVKLELNQHEHTSQIEMIWNLLLPPSACISLNKFKLQSESVSRIIMWSWSQFWQNWRKIRIYSSTHQMTSIATRGKIWLSEFV